VAGKRTTGREPFTPAQAATAAAKAVRAKAQETTPATKEAQAAPAPRAVTRPRPPRQAANAGDVLEEIRGVKRMLQQLLAPPRSGMDALEASVDALRRLLSELMDERMQAIMEDVADIRREAAVLPGAAGERVAERLEHLLENLGAVRFAAEPMDLVDPLIHAVVERRSADGAPEGVILATLRPGYRTARGRVLCKAAVAVSGRA
jgi:molecular chaperone GrpE (heat shock protein)